MTRKRFSEEDILGILRQIEMAREPFSNFLLAAIGDHQLNPEVTIPRHTPSRVPNDLNC